MCATCGCDSNEKIFFHEHGNHADHEHTHNGHTHTHEKTVVEVEQDILYQNNLLAARNRGFLEAKNIFAINLVSSPGSGKTTLLEKTLIALKEKLNLLL